MSKFSEVILYCQPTGYKTNSSDRKYFTVLNLSMIYYSYILLILT